MRPRTLQVSGVRWRCIRCAASGIGLDLDEATVLVIRHCQKVHREEDEER